MCPFCISGTPTGLAADRGYGEICLAAVYSPQRFCRCGFNEAMVFFAHDGLFYWKLQFPPNPPSLVAPVPEDTDVTFGARPVSHMLKHLLKAPRCRVKSFLVGLF